MPVAAEVGSGQRHDDDMPLAHADLAVATGTEVGLARLVGLHAADLDLIVGVVVGAGHDRTR